MYLDMFADHLDHLQNLEFFLLINKAHTISRVDGIGSSGHFEPVRPAFCDRSDFFANRLGRISRPYVVCITIEKIVGGATMKCFRRVGGEENLGTAAGGAL